MLAALLLVTGLTPAEDPYPAFEQLGNEPRWVASVGTFNASGDTDGPAFGIEYRWPYEDDPWWGIEEVAPIAGVQVDTDGNLYGYAGLRHDWAFADDWVLTPSLSAGLFDEGSTLDLGYGLEFRSCLEVSRSIGDSSRLGLSVFHLSNASLGSDNPGTNGMVVTWSWAPSGD